MNLLILILVILLICGIPQVGISHNFGYYPSGGIGLILVIILILYLLRVI